ncbi:MAG: tRNA (adenosine(37)-N6)-threonylcarbamoyltransferase complex transferase subunit TsaD [Lachnospiraceae bacterium]|nr:tRNA (adenosine(37)-N6)-threonylcarbamoyltransferase complex transferase subunit TsaD [Lachnospiraceae bacterium]
MKDIQILAIESSCDETAAAVVRNGREVLSNTIYSQIDLHTLYGGVVPEIASRKHIEKINYVIEEALRSADRRLEDMDAIAVTYGPGLVGALLVGVAEAKAISFATGKPLVGVHHIEGHIAANYIEHQELEPPFLCLVVSGGHTHLVVVRDYSTFEIIGRTQDDAAGEAFDKVARAVGLGYPGGPKVDKCAVFGRPDAVAFPRGHVGGSFYDFSFSGLKSAVLNYLNSCRMKQGLDGNVIYSSKTDRPDFDPFEKVDPESGVTVADVVASFQAAVVDVLVGHTIHAAHEYGYTKVAMAGGVASNSALRKAMSDACSKDGLELFYPSPVLCTDNAAMIGCAAYYEYMAGVRHGYDLNAVPGLKLGERI